MNQNNKFRLEQQTKRRHWALRFKNGCKAIITDKRKTGVLLAYLAFVLLIWFFRVPIFGLRETDMLGTMKRAGIENLLSVGSIAGVFALIILFGSPFGAKAIHDNLQRIGFANHAGESPLLVGAYRDKEHPNVEVLEFEANGIPRTKWEDEQAKLEAALNVHVVKVKEGANKRRILLYTVPVGAGLPDFLYWKDEYLNPDSFVLVLGEGLLGKVTVNLAQIPHILLGGSTGSGKSVLLKLLLMQCIQKKATVFIADFKGGVDFPDVWYGHCEIITSEQELLNILATLVDELEHRKVRFKSADCPNLDAYNKKTGATLRRMVFACDEVAEVLDKTGRDKQGKELVAKIEGMLSVLARQGRAFGIHLILATQRPDANILAGQIKNNLDCRVCGRADNVLSQIILDNTDAADQIPKDAQGRFLMHDGTVFQGYLFNEYTAFEGRSPYD